MKVRLWALAAAALLVAAGLVVHIGLTTLENLYPGPDAVRASRPVGRMPQHPVVADVTRCVRVGPLSGNGFGYWWECAATIRSEGGRETSTVLRRSIVSPSDVGTPVSLRAACPDATDTDCSYGRPANAALGIAVWAFQYVHLLILLGFLVFVLRYLARAALGEERFTALTARRRHSR